MAAKAVIEAARGSNAAPERLPPRRRINKRPAGEDGGDDAAATQPPKFRKTGELTTNEFRKMLAKSIIPIIFEIIGRGAGIMSWFHASDKEVVRWSGRPRRNGR